VSPREAADEPLGPDQAHLDPAHLLDRPRAIEHSDRSRLERGLHLLDAIGMPVVVAEHGEHRELELAEGRGQHFRLLGLAVGGPVAGEQQQVGLTVQAGERLDRWAAPIGPAMDIGHRGHPHGRPAGERLCRLMLRSVGAHAAYPWRAGLKNAARG
jgi:hypothetical protein